MPKATPEVVKVCTCVISVVDTTGVPVAILEADICKAEILIEGVPVKGVPKVTSERLKVCTCVISVVNATGVPKVMSEVLRVCTCVIPVVDTTGIPKVIPLTPSI